MNDKIKFLIGQKKRYLNEIASRIADFKLNGKDLGVFVAIEEDGHLRTPRNFEDEHIVLSSEEYDKLSKKDKKKYDKEYHESTRYLVACFNECNKKYIDMFEQLELSEKIDVLQFEINALQIDEIRAKAYYTTLSRKTIEQKQANFDSKKKLTDEQIDEISQEITQIKYLQDQLKIKQDAISELKKEYYK